MALREELEKLVCGDRVLIEGKEYRFGCIKPDDSWLPVLLYTADKMGAYSFEVIEIIKPKKKLWAYRLPSDQIMYFTCENQAHNDWERAPEWDREQV